MQVLLNNTSNTYDSEPAWSQCGKFQETFRSYASSWMPLQNLVPEGNETLFISGSYIRPVAIRDLLINETGERQRWTYTLTLNVCM